MKDEGSKIDRLFILSATLERLRFKFPKPSKNFAEEVRQNRFGRVDRNASADAAIRVASGSDVNKIVRKAERGARFRRG